MAGRMDETTVAKLVVNWVDKRADRWANSMAAC
jgi:hypothetical protein